MIKYLKGNTHPYSPKDQFACIKGYEAVKTELCRLLKMLELSNKISDLGGIAITGPANSGKYFIAETFASAAARSVYSFNAEPDLREGIEAIIKALESSDNTEPVLLLIRHLNHMRSSCIDQLNSYLENTGYDVTILATAEDTDGTVSYAKDTGLINLTVPVGAPTLRDTSALLKYLIYEKYSDIVFEMNLNDMASVTYQYSYSSLDRLLSECVLSAQADHIESITMDLFMECVMRREFGRCSITEDYPDTMVFETAIHEAGHALAGVLTGVDVAYVCICRHGKSNQFGYTKFLREDSELSTTTEGMIIKLGGMAAEEICNNYVSIGSKEDIYHVTSGLEELIIENGTLGIEYVKVLSADESDELKAFREKKIQEQLVNIYEKTKGLLLPYKDLIQELADQLLKKEYILGPSINSLVRTPC